MLVQLNDEARKIMMHGIRGQTSLADGARVIEVMTNELMVWPNRELVNNWATAANGLLVLMLELIADGKWEDAARTGMDMATALALICGCLVGPVSGA